jgi:hypothetical protein
MALRVAHLDAQVALESARPVLQMKDAVVGDGEDRRFAAIVEGLGPTLQIRPRDEHVQVFPRHKRTRGITLQRRDVLWPGLIAARRDGPERLLQLREIVVVPPENGVWLGRHSVLKKGFYIRLLDPHFPRRGEVAAVGEREGEEYGVDAARRCPRENIEIRVRMGEALDQPIRAHAVHQLEKFLGGAVLIDG